MLAPGAIFSVGGRVESTIGAATVSNFMNQGIGFMANGDVAIDTDAPAGANFKGGIRLNSSGAVYGTVTPNGGDIWVGGLRVSTEGQLVYEVADATSFVNGNPITATGRFAVN